MKQKNHLNMSRVYQHMIIFQILTDILKILSKRTNNIITQQTEEVKQD